MRESYGKFQFHSSIGIRIAFAGSSQQYACPLSVRLFTSLCLFLLLLFCHISDERRPRIGSESRTAKNLRGRESVQSRDATTMPMIVEGADHREPGGPGSWMDGRDVVSRPSPGNTTGERNQKPLGEEKMTRCHGNAQEGPCYPQTLPV
jgi:hypothetical protein